ncbi:MAG: L-threonylcarbamoyladenylate synthase, partial [Phycisphaerae bacterium]
MAQLETGLADAVALLHAGQVVAFATETVYGLGADARQPEAIARIYTAKGRPSYNPLIVHVATPADAREYMATVSAFAPELMAAFWPGPLTLVVPRGGALAPSVSAGLPSVALRCPAHPLAQALLRAFAGPIAAPSANRSGFVSPTTAAHVLAELDGRILLILDGGASAIGLESTVVDLTTSPPTLLRPGGITAEQIR